MNAHRRALREEGKYLPAITSAISIARHC